MLIFIILYGISWLSLFLLPEFQDADLTSDLVADYSPWLFTAYKPVDQRLIQEIFQDNQIDPEVNILKEVENTGLYLTPTLGNTYPETLITAPSSGSSAIEGSSVTFKGIATDTEDGLLNGSLVWFSSIDGSIGSGGTVSTSSLSVGTHTITASVTDSGGLTDSDSITISIAPPNTAPAATIIAPADSSSHLSSASVTFTGTASDPEDGNLSGSLTWTSSIDGVIGSGGTVSTSSLSVGAHTITASVTDSGGLTDSDNITVTIAPSNTPPTASVSAPSNGSSYKVGNPVTFKGGAADTEDGNLSSSLVWISSINGTIGSGGTFSTSGLSMGAHTITASVTDSGGLTDSDSITITIVPQNTAPAATITAPAESSSYLSGASVTFTGTASDPEDGNLNASLTWTSSINGSIGSGGTVSTSSLSVGTHTITASVTDSGGLTDSDSITVTITPPNTSPTAVITAPADGSSYLFSTSITLTGTASDVEDGDLSGSLVWTSSIDGAIGSGGTFSTSGLSVGTHTITALVTDSGGLSGTDSITVTITPPNTPPTAAITAPADGSSYLFGTSITLTGTASDVEDGDLSGSLVWTSTIDGLIGSGGTFSISDLSVGTHTITASVIDSGGLIGTNSFTITITTPNAPPTVTITAPADDSSYQTGTSITFTGTANDYEDGNLSGSLVWISSIDGPIGSGGTFSSSSLSVGTHMITASVADSGGLTDSGSTTVTITPLIIPLNTPPTVAINSPANGSTQFILLNFSGTASDAEDGNLNASLVWTSSINGVIGSGGAFFTGLSVGTHTITASVTDSGGLTGSDSITITVGFNIPPLVIITSPSNGSTFSSVASVNFQGWALDIEDGGLSDSLTWTSSIDGSIGSGGTFSTSSLSVGTHTITASVTDSGGLTGSNSIKVIITTPNTSPTIAITSPAPGSSYLSGNSVIFTGTASDTEDGNLSGSLTWTSNIDGGIGSGDIISTSSLSVGIHTITASVTDSGGLTDSDSLTISIIAPESLQPQNGLSQSVPDILENSSGAGNTSSEGEPSDTVSAPIENTSFETNPETSEAASGEVNNPSESEPPDTESPPVESTTSETNPETTETTSGDGNNSNEGESTNIMSASVESTISETNLEQSEATPGEGSDLIKGRSPSTMRIPSRWHDIRA